MGAATVAEPVSMVLVATVVKVSPPACSGVTGAGVLTGVVTGTGVGAGVGAGAGVPTGTGVGAEGVPVVTTVTGAEVPGVELVVVAGAEVTSNASTQM